MGTTRPSHMIGFMESPRLAPRRGMPTARRPRVTRITRQPRRAPNYDRKLVRRIMLEDGTKLATEPW